MDWRAWTLTSSSVHLVFLVVCFVLAYFNLWPSWHHKKIKNFSPATRDLIREVVNNNWKKLMDCTRDLIDARLEDGENYIKLSQSSDHPRIPLLKCIGSILALPR